MAGKGSEQFKAVIKAHLDKEAEQDGNFAMRYANPEKSLDECVDYILTTVKESGCVGFDDPEIYGMAVHYYQEDEPGKISKGISATCVVNHHIDLSESEKEEALRRAQAEEERARRQEEEAKKSKRSFGCWIAKFKGLQIEGGNGESLVIRPLLSIQEFMEEGRAMHHCVFSNGYYKRRDCLILTARKKEDGERVETVEVDLKGWSIRQSRGIYNGITDWHDEIQGLVMGAMPQIQKMAHPKKKMVSASHS